MTKVAVVPGGLLLATGRFPNTKQLVIVDAMTGAPRMTPITLDNGSINDLDTSADGRLAVASTGDEVLLLDSVSGVVARRISVAPAAFAVRFVLGGSRLAVWQSTATSGRPEDHAIHLYDAPSLEEVGPTIATPSTVAGLAALHEAALVLTARDAGGAALWNLGGSSSAGGGGFRRAVAQVQLPPSDTAFTADGSVAISTGPRATVVARALDSGQELWRHDLFRDGQFASAAAVSPDGTLAAIGGGTFISPEQGSVVLVEPRTGRVISEHALAPTQVRSLAFSPDGRYLFGGASDLLGRVGAVVALELATGTTYQLDDAAPKDLTVMGDRVVWINATGGLSSTTMTNVASGRPVSASTLADPLSRLVSTGRSGELAVASGGRVGLVDLGDAALEPRWLGDHRTWVSSLTVSPSGRVLVSTDGGGGLIFWDLVAGRALSTPISLGTSNGLNAIFSPREGAADLLLVSDAGLALIDGDPEGWEARACRIANRDLTTAEWDRFVGSGRPYTSVCPAPPT